MLLSIDIELDPSIWLSSVSGIFEDPAQATFLLLRLSVGNLMLLGWSERFNRLGALPVSDC